MVVRAADLERSSALELFVFEEDRATCQPRQTVAVTDGGGADNWVYQLSRSLDGGQRD